MFVKTTFEGKSMIKYSIAVFIINIVLIAAFIMTSIQNVFNVIEHIEAVVNTGAILSLMLILKQIGWVFLWLIITGVLEVVVVFGIILPIARSEMKSRW